MFDRPSPFRFYLVSGLLLVHGVITAKAMVDHGLIGIFLQAFLNWGTGQIFSDLVVSLVLVMSWVLVDARRRGKTGWPWVLVTAVFGSLGPLVYLFLRERALLREAPKVAVV